jgi:hypothetical protein
LWLRATWPVLRTGSFVACPRDACALPETAAGFANSLNRKIGQQDGPRERIVSVQALVASGAVVESRTQFVSCRGTLVFASGQAQNGTISVIDRSAGEIVQSSWQSDEAVQKFQDQQRAQARKKNSVPATNELRNERL